MSEALFRLEVDSLDAIPKNLPLIALFRSMSDVCQLVQGVEQHLWETTDPQLILSFKSDLLLDYRAHRPAMLFKRDRLLSYEPEELALYLCTDSLGKQFLMLAGFEPNFRWERFIDSVLLLIEELAVSTTVWLHSLPMPVPHTRPVSMCLHGTREDFIEANTDWQPTSQIAATIGHLLEYRLTQLEQDVIGCALLLPHYIANNYFPGGALAGISVFSRLTDLIISTEELLARNEEFMTQLEAQFAESEELLEMLHSLERRYDRFQSEKHRDGFFMDDVSDEIPSADLLASQFQEFLESSVNDPKFNRDQDAGQLRADPQQPESSEEQAENKGTGESRNKSDGADNAE